MYTDPERMTASGLAKNGFLDSSSPSEIATTLPYSWYVDPEILRLEREHIFKRTWQHVGWTVDVEGPGDSFTCHVAGVPIVVVRDKAGALRAFVNACRHRGHPVAEGCRKRSSLQCPYHGWTYGLDGALRAAPRSDREPRFEPSEWGLIPARVDTWGRMVFVNLDPEAVELHEWLGEMPAVVERSGVDFESLQVGGRREVEVRTNWKAYTENSLECYHCPTIHPAVSEIFDTDRTVECHDQVVLFELDPRVSPRHGRSSGPELSSTAYFPYVWPNFQVFTTPDASGTALTVHSWVPTAPTRTRAEMTYFFPADATPELRAEFLEYADRTLDEDVKVVESVQAGISSGALPHGRLLPASEEGVLHFDRLVSGALAAALEDGSADERA